MERAKPIKSLRCCVCGEATKGRQWFNRDTGFGLCERCADWVSKRETEAEMLSLYGRRGEHYAVED